MYQGCVNFPGNPNMESRLETTEEASRYPLTLRDLKVDGTKVSPGGAEKCLVIRRASLYLVVRNSGG